jgi:lipoprotein-anchoring transpeptidase ErfK/SrfK
MLCVRAAASGRLCCAALVTASIALSAASQASAATYYWNDSEPAIVSPERVAPSRRQKAKHTQDKASKTAVKEAAKPQGPLIVAVSINKQQVKVYDSNGLFTESPVSSGMQGHATPMGVFSVIQKQKFHRSNIYSNAPMPFMQRVTWSGIALHAGVLPGYPASHGCIRMPPSFAVKMYGLTRIGARVLITPGEVAPSSFTHPLLAAFKAPGPTASAQPAPNVPASTKSDKGAALPASTTAAMALDLRTSIGHGDAAKPAVGVSTASLREQTHTADASNATGASLTASDVPSATAPPRADAPKADAAATPAESKTADDMAVPTKPAPEIKGAKTTASTSDPSRAVDSNATASKLDGSKPDESKPDASKPAEAKTADAPAEVKDPNKDQTEVSDGDTPAVPARPELKHNSQIAVFISRKDGKLYVRQSLAPVFSTPVTIAPSDRPLGTHLFTAATDKTDANVLHWSVVSMPSRAGTRSEDTEKALRHGTKAANIEAKATPLPDNATEALDRITIPADVMAWLGEALSTGSSLIVSDQGINQGETGEGTEFILSLR